MPINNSIYMNARNTLSSFPPLISLTIVILIVILLVSSIYLVRAIYVPIPFETNNPQMDWNPPKFDETQFVLPNQNLDTNEIILRSIFTINKNNFSINKNSGLSRLNKNNEFIESSSIGISLSAIIKINNDWRVFIKSKNDINGSWKLIGDTIDGWSIVSIDDNKITLNTESKYTEIMLFRENVDK